jgi:hypothetical protein
MRKHPLPSPAFILGITSLGANWTSLIHTARVTEVLEHTIQLERWFQGLSVMLEKTLGVTLVTKLWAVLLMKANFNASNKIMYSVRMMNQAQKHNMMSEEIYSEKNRMVDDGMLTKTLFYDIT